MIKTSSKVMLTLTISATLLLGGVSTAFAQAPAPASKSFSGYLMDVNCGTKGKDTTGKIDITKNPQKHLVSCLNMMECMDSGLGMMIKEGKTYKFYKFDKKGSKLADDNIMMMTKKKFNVKIAVTGVKKGNIITVDSVKEAK